MAEPVNVGRNFRQPDRPRLRRLLTAPPVLRTPGTAVPVLRNPGGPSAWQR